MHSRPPFPEKVLIIGSGIGGLSTAVILAGMGVEVTVVEKNAHPGGLMRSYRRQGMDCEVGVHYLGSLDPGQILHRFFSYLGVAEDIRARRMGADGVIDRYLFASLCSPIDSFDLPSGVSCFAERLHAAFPQDHQTIASITASITRAAEQLHGLDLLYADDADFTLLDQAEPLGQTLAEMGCSPGLRSVLAIAASWIGVPLDDCPAYYHNMALASYLSSSYRLEQSGADMADIFVRRLGELGGRVFTDAEVTELLVTSRQVQGVQLRSGEILSAPCVIGAVHPQVVLQMLPRGAVKPSYVKRITGLVNTHGIFAVHAAVDRSYHPEIHHNIFRIDTGSAGNVHDLKYFQIRNSRHPDKNILSLLTSGQDELWSTWQHTRTGRRGQEYINTKEQRAATLLVEAEQLFGTLHGLELLDVSTPLTMRDWVNTPGGSAYGVLRSSSQVLGTALLNRTAVQGLYLAGQNVTAPGIIGTIMGSFGTVKLLLGAERFKEKVQL